MYGPKKLYKCLGIPPSHGYPQQLLMYGPKKLYKCLPRISAASPKDMRRSKTKRHAPQQHKAHASIGPDSLRHASSTRHTRVTARDRGRRAPQALHNPNSTRHTRGPTRQAATRPLPYTSENTSSPDKTGSNKARASATKAATRNEPRSISRASRVRHAPLLQTRATRHVPRGREISPAHETYLELASLELRRRMKRRGVP